MFFEVRNETFLLTSQVRTNFVCRVPKWRYRVEGRRRYRQIHRWSHMRREGRDPTAVKLIINRRWIIDVTLDRGRPCYFRKIQLMLTLRWRRERRRVRRERGRTEEKRHRIDWFGKERTNDMEKGSEKGWMRERVEDEKKESLIKERESRRSSEENAVTLPRSSKPLMASSVKFATISTQLNCRSTLSVITIARSCGGT